jgi:hypothetical protein
MVMPTPRSRQAARLRARRRRAQLRARRIALLAAVSVLAAVTLFLTAFDGGRSSSGQAALDDDVRSAPSGAIRPRPEVLATVGNLPIQLPITAGEVTAIGYHGASDGARTLQPVGRQGNEGLLARLWRNIAGSGRSRPVWYQLSGPPGTEVLDVGARVNADVYAPVDGTVLAISDQVVDDRVVGARIDLRPAKAPSVTLSLVNLDPDPALAVGTPVLASVSKLGTVIDIADREEQSLAEVSGDAGNNVAISVYPAVGSLP